MHSKKRNFQLSKYFEMLSSLILDGAIKVIQSKNNVAFSERGGTTYDFTKTCLLWSMRLIIMEILFCGTENVKL